MDLCPFNSPLYIQINNRYTVRIQALKEYRSRLLEAIHDHRHEEI